MCRASSKQSSVLKVCFSIISSVLHAASLACVAVYFARPMRARSGLAEPRGVRAGPSVQNQTLRNLNGTSNNIKSLKGCKATTLKLQWSTIYNSNTIYKSN